MATIPVVEDFDVVAQIGPGLVSRAAVVGQTPLVASVRSMEPCSGAGSDPRGLGTPRPKSPQDFQAIRS